MPQQVTRQTPGGNCCAPAVVPCCFDGSPAPLVVIAEFQKVAPFGGTTCSPPGPWTVPLYNTCHYIGGCSSTLFNWFTASGFAIPTSGPYPCNLDNIFRAIQLSCNSGPGTAVNSHDITNDTGIGSLLNVGPGEWWIKGNCFLGPYGAKTANLISCRPFHLRFDFVEFIDGIRWSNGSGYQGWQIDVTE